MTTDEFINRQITMFTSPWFKYFFTYDPSETWLKINCPVLVISGDKDVQAPPSLNLPAIKNGLASGGNSDVTIKELKNVNHMFQECRTGMVDEYALLDETFSPLALNEIGQWLKQRIK